MAIELSTEYFPAINPKQTVSQIVYEDFSTKQVFDGYPGIGSINYALNCPTQCSGLYRRNAYATPQWHKEYAVNGAMWDGNWGEQFFWSNLPDGGTSAWLAVDLAQKVVIDRIRVWYATDEYKTFATGVLKTYIDGKLSIEIETERIAEHGQDNNGYKYYDLILRDGTAYLPAINRVVLYSQFGQYLKVWELQVLGALEGTMTPRQSEDKLLQKVVSKSGSWVKNPFGEPDYQGNLELYYDENKIVPTTRVSGATRAKAMYINTGKPSTRDYTIYADLYYHHASKNTKISLIGRATQQNYYIAIFDIEKHRFSLGRKYRQPYLAHYSTHWYLNDSYYPYDGIEGEAGVTRQLKMVFSGDTISAYYNGNLLGSVTDPVAYNDIGLTGLCMDRYTDDEIDDIAVTRYWVKDKSYDDNIAGPWEYPERSLVVDSRNAGANMQGMGKTQFLWVEPDWSKYPHKDRMTELKMRVTGSVSQSFFLKFAFALQDTANHTRYISVIDQLKKYSEGLSMTDIIMSHEISITDPEILKNWDKIIGVIWGEGNAHTVILDGIEFKTSYTVPRGSKRRFSIVY